MRDDKGPCRAALGAVAAIAASAMVLTPIGWIHWRKSVRADNERQASAMLKTLASAEADFRGNDRDNNGIQDFWTADVASLHDMVPAGGSAPLGLIDPRMARADPTRPGARPFAGYWFVAIPLDETGSAYAMPELKGRNYSKFGFCAYPADYGRTGTHTFIINEGGTIYKEDLKGQPRKQWPADSELKTDYSKID